MLFLSSRPFLSDPQNLLRTILAVFTDKESIFVVGIPPYFPSTSYGYLSSEGNLESDEFLRVRQFIEKPIQKASELFKKKGYFGIQEILSQSLQHC